MTLYPKMTPEWEAIQSVLESFQMHSRKMLMLSLFSLLSIRVARKLPVCVKSRNSPPFAL